MSEYVHMCLTDLLDQDLSSQEYFNTLPTNVRHKLISNGDARTFSELQEQAEKYKSQL